MKTAIVFDMDGVLADTEKLYRMHWIKAGEEIGKSRELMDEISSRIAGGTREHTNCVFREYFGNDFDVEGFRVRTYEMMDAYIAQHGIECKPGVKEFLPFLKERGVKLAVATSTKEERARKNLERLGLLSYFDELVFGDSIEKGKPNPDIYLKACELLKVKPEEAVAVEDSINGMKSCMAAGMVSVMVIDLILPTEEVKKGADRIYQSMTELMAEWDTI